MTTQKPVAVFILDEEYLISCPPEEERALQESAQLLDQRMKAIRKSGKVMSNERIAVMAGLNISNELLQLQQQLEHRTTGINEHLRSLRTKIESVLRS
jgi:cell division protein ZapA